MSNYVVIWWPKHNFSKVSVARTGAITVVGASRGKYQRMANHWVAYRGTFFECKCIYYSDGIKSKPNLKPSTVCSDPTLSLLPQWKCSWVNWYLFFPFKDPWLKSWTGESVGLNCKEWPLLTKLPEIAFPYLFNFKSRVKKTFLAYRLYKLLKVQWLGYFIILGIWVLVSNHFSTFNYKSTEEQVKITKGG